MQTGQYEELKRQNKFCGELGRRLCADIEAAEAWGNGDLKYIGGITRFRADIKRLRRELNTLNKLLD